MKAKKERKIVAVGCVHAEYVDESLINAWFQFLRDYKPDEVVILGDLINFGSLSFFKKVKTKGETIKKDAAFGEKFIGRIRKTCKSAKIVFVWGNHEQRLERWKDDHPELEDSKEYILSNLLQFKKHRVKECKYDYIPFPGVKYIMLHGEKYGDNAAMNQLNKERCSGMMAHGHKTRIAVKGGHFDPECFLMIGTMADKKKIDRAEKFSVALRWDQSFATITVAAGEKFNPLFDVEPVLCGKKGFYSRYTRKFYKRRK